MFNDNQLQHDIRQPQNDIRQLLAALLIARGQFKDLIKSVENKFLSDKNKKKVCYATLVDYIDCTVEALTANGLQIVQLTEIKDGRSILSTTLYHTSGQSIRSEMILPVEGGAQAIGGCITYYRRYMYGAMLNIAPDDDDDGTSAQKNYADNMAQKKKIEEEAKRKQEEEKNQNNGKITKQEIGQLNYLLNKLSDDKKENFWKYLNNNNFFDWTDITKEKFPTIIKKLNSTIKELEDQGNAP